jgi:hypothetical protein
LTDHLLTSPAFVLLQQDLAFIAHNHQSLAKAHALHDPTPDEERYMVTALGLWTMLVEHARAITLLLSEGLIYSARALNRTAYEASIHLVYLATVGDKYENARFYETNMLLAGKILIQPSMTGSTVLRRPCGGPARGDIQRVRLPEG